MSPEVVARERSVGWMLAGVAAFHLLLLQPREWVMVSVFVLLMVGAILRGRAIRVPGWIGHLGLGVGIIGVFLSPGWRIPLVASEVAAVFVATLLLRPVTVGRGQWILLGLLGQLIGLFLKSFPTVGPVFIVADVAVLLLLSEQICRPPEARVNFWVSMLRSLRLIVPVGMIVTLIFWFFPSVASDDSATFTGFSGNGFLDPGSVVELAQSRRIAFTARFPEDQAIPAAAELYWRGQALEINEGMRWERLSRRFDRRSVLRASWPEPGEPQVRYSQELAATRGGLVPVLDHALFLRAWREGDEVTVLDLGGATLSAVGAGPLVLDVAASLGKLSDRPPPNLDGGNLAVPKKIRDNPAIQQIAVPIFSGKTGTVEKLHALAGYWKSSDFRYSRRPGRINGLEDFLINRRRGFCEHYAVATANLLRLGGVPARVILGYRGGSWNPWTRTITVRDSQAHAWVEAWDEGTEQWLRFDPTRFVAPEIDRGVRWEMDSDQWPWYWSLIGFLDAVVTWIREGLGAVWNRWMTPEGWEPLNQLVLAGLLLGGTVWLIRANWRRAEPSAELAIRSLARLERRAAQLARARHPGETPLAWLDRLVELAADEDEKNQLRQFAECYETLRYGAAGEPHGLLISLRECAVEILRRWRNDRAS